MKKYISIIISLLCVATVFAQEDTNSKAGTRQKYHQEELKYIESKNILTEEQFAKFTEAYTEYRNSLKKIRQENAILKPQDGEDITEQQAKSNVDALVNKMTQKTDLNKEYILKLQGFMTNKQILEVQKAQSKFKREKFKELSKH
jgi:hypothetical protein